MNRKYYVDLKEARLTRSDELLAEAEYLLEKQAYKSANNRAYYAIEQGIKVLLAEKQIDVLTHNGVIKQFNYEYIHNRNACAECKNA